MPSFKTGFSDFFPSFATAGTLSTAMQRVKDARGQYVRVAIDWKRVEPNYPGEGNTGTVGDHAAVGTLAQQFGLKVIPHVVNCPTSWIPESERAKCRPDMPTDDHWYPIGAGATKYADFFGRIIDMYDSCGVIDCIEVWNEPNLGSLPGSDPYYKHDLWIPSPQHYGALFGTTLSRIHSAYDGRIKVVSGGLFLPTASDKSHYWQDYLDVVARQCQPFGIGIHPYDTRDPDSTKSSSWNADRVADRVLASFDMVTDYLLAAHGVATTKLWLTETGASSRGRYTEDGQRRALRLITEGLEARASRCEMMCVYTLYEPPPDVLVDIPQFREFWLLNEDWSPKAAMAELGASIWL